MNAINKLNPEEMGRTRLVNTGFEEELSPEPTAYNMLLLMKKINELIDDNNDLRSRLTNVEPDTTASQPVNPECGVG